MRNSGHSHSHEISLYFVLQLNKTKIKYDLVSARIEYLHPVCWIR